MLYFYIFISISISSSLFCNTKLHAHMLTALALVECVFNLFHFLICLGFFSLFGGVTVVFLAYFLHFKYSLVFFL